MASVQRMADVDLRGKRVLIREDLNVPVQNGVVTSDARIRAWVAPLDEFSFPSGHTLHAVAFTVVALAHYPVLAWLLTAGDGMACKMYHVWRRPRSGTEPPSDATARCWGDAR